MPPHNISWLTYKWFSHKSRLFPLEGHLDRSADKLMEPEWAEENRVCACISESVLSWGRNQSLTPSCLCIRNWEMSQTICSQPSRHFSAATVSSPFLLCLPSLIITLIRPFDPEVLLLPPTSYCLVVPPPPPPPLFPIPHWHLNQAPSILAP